LKLKVSPINGSNKHYMKQQQHQSIHALSNLESQDLSGYLNNQTSDLMNKLSTVVSFKIFKFSLA
jgi:hypothetical protein